MAPDRFGNVMHAIRPEEEVPAENLPPEQIIITAWRLEVAEPVGATS